MERAETTSVYYIQQSKSQEADYGNQVEVDILRMKIPCLDPLFTKKTEKKRVQEADLGDEVEACSVHASHDYHVQEADLGKKWRPSWRGWRPFLFMFLMSTVFRRLT